MSFAQEMQSIAVELLREFGTSAKITTEGGKAINGIAVAVNRQRTDTNSQYVVRKSNTVYFTGSVVAPLPGDVLTFGSVSYVIESVEQFNPDAKTNVVWKMEVAL